MTIDQEVMYGITRLSFNNIKYVEKLNIILNIEERIILHIAHL